MNILMWSFSGFTVLVMLIMAGAVFAKNHESCLPEEDDDES